MKEAKQQGEDGSANGMVGSLASNSHNHKHNNKRISIFRWSKDKKEQESQMKTSATRYIQNVTKSSPTNNKNKRKAELSKPGKYDQKVMENSKAIYTGRGTL